MVYLVEQACPKKMDVWVNERTGEKIHRERHELQEDVRCWVGPKEFKPAEGRSYFRYITHDHFSPDVLRLGSMTRMDVLITVCVTKKLPVNMIIDPCYHTVESIHAKMLELYPDLPKLIYCRVPGEKLDCQDFMSGDIIYALEPYKSQKVV